MAIEPWTHNNAGLQPESYAILNSSEALGPAEANPISRFHLFSTINSLFRRRFMFLSLLCKQSTAP